MDEEILVKLRGKKITYFLIEGETRLVDPLKYPFKRGLLPIQCKLVGEERDPFFAFTSGNRSLVLLIDNDICFKAKATGIPLGISQPILYEGKLFTYHLTHAMIGSGDLIWGLSSMKETEREEYWMSKAKELGLPATDPIGIGIYQNVYVIEFKDRITLFKYLEQTSIQKLIKVFMKHSNEIQAACMFCKGPTDVRVDEILYGFLFPRVDEILDLNDCINYLKWLGSSCGYNLRLHHDQGIMHGTIPRYPYILTNSHLANHLVNETKTWMTDYHMAGEIKDERIKTEELFSLCHVMVPLPSAKRIAEMRFKEKPRPLYLQMISQISSEWTQELIFNHYKPIKPVSKGEKLTEALISGIEYGYFRREIFQIESHLKRRLFWMLVNLKEKLWELYNLPKGMQREADYVPIVISSRKVQDEEISRILQHLRDSIA